MPFNDLTELKEKFPVEVETDSLEIVHYKQNKNIYLLKGNIKGIDDKVPLGFITL